MVPGLHPEVGYTSRMTESERQAEIAWYNLQRHLVDTGQDPITAADQTEEEEYDG